MKFLVDAMLGKLARFLRIFGYDAVYANDLISYYNLDPVPDEKLLEFALNDQRTIITKDLGFYLKIKDNAILLQDKGVYNYLKQLKSSLNLKFEFNINNARCSVCNSKLNKILDKKSIEHLVQPESFKKYNDFYQCSNSECAQIFWEGIHILDIVKKTMNNVNRE